mmetsp:Transcript_70127/g.226948  ORF Transcript_70127/g.226948 Transcript_70127/m.226948 type:complete len:225 (-) Transcript_70127:410-1084(-)
MQEDLVDGPGSVLHIKPRDKLRIVLFKVHDGPQPTRLLSPWAGLLCGRAHEHRADLQHWRLGLGQGRRHLGQADADVLRVARDLEALFASQHGVPQVFQGPLQCWRQGPHVPQKVLGVRLADGADEGLRRCCRVALRRCVFLGSPGTRRSWGRRNAHLQGGVDGHAELQQSLLQVWPLQLAVPRVQPYVILHERARAGAIGTEACCRDAVVILSDHLGHRSAKA